MIYELYESQLQQVCGEKDFTLEKIGTAGKHKKYPIYKVEINCEPQNKKICFSAGIHGDEPSGPWGLLEFLKKYDAKNSKIGIVILPVLNPTGFDKARHENFRNLNLNKHFFDKRMTGEVKQIYDSVKNENIFFFVAYHEDNIKKGAYLYAYSNNGLDMYEKILEVIGKHYCILNEGNIYRNKAQNGIIASPKSDGSLEERLFFDGVPYSTCIEIPDKKPLKRRANDIAKISQGIRKIIEKSAS